MHEGLGNESSASARVQGHGEAKVKVEQGWLQGEQVDLVTGDGSYYSFKGIPYAAPPLGKLRFMAPQPPPSWEGVKEALKHGPMCPQFDIFTKELILAPKASENCLYLNVYSPNLKPEQPLPVMFFIHGGGYKSDSGDVDHYGPDFLVEYGIVLVTINYRLDALGFLSLENDDVPGNAGMKDQVAALRWVQNNIAIFGGDPSNVTIFGESAGGASVGYHVLSPMSKGLFHRAILMSGVPFCDWSTPYAPRRHAFALAKQLGKNTKCDKELLEFLQNASVEKLVNTHPNVLISETLSDNSIKMYHFTPVVEKDRGRDHFLTDTPENYMKKGNLNEVDVMIGHTDQESLFDIDTVMELLNTYETFSELFVPWKILLKERPSKILKLSDKIKNHYFGEKPISRETLKEMMKYISDSTFVYDIHNFLSSLPPSEKRRYLYQFSCVSERNIYSRGAASICPDLIGAAHLEDLVYLFDPKYANLTIDVTSKSYKMIKQTCSLFTNFAKYGNPTPQNSDLGVAWQQYQPKDKHYLDIGEILKPGKNLKQHVIEFWQSIYDEAL
ncbi:Esterase B1 [Eumeta japonica]|uniref:Carboxylic ester hydrolase n=1 Tax=Eumeta variegata TaxID=151549 RepID=A0A4C1WJ25_EUMVA|nr:Esterase B1 [Eumeta japonica]